jgi:hypothetical protein
MIAKSDDFEQFLVKKSPFLRKRVIITTFADFQQFLVKKLALF